MGARLFEYLNSTVWEGNCQVQSLNQTIKDNYSTIANREKEFKPIDYRTIDNSTIGTSKKTAKDVDKLLEICSDLIASDYTQWFAKRFYSLDRERVITLASQARQDARTSPERLFSYLINKEFNDGD